MFPVVEVSKTFNPELPFRGRKRDRERRRHLNGKCAIGARRFPVAPWDPAWTFLIAATGGLSPRAGIKQWFLLGAVAIALGLVGGEATKAASLQWSPDGVTPGAQPSRRSTVLPTAT